MITKERAQELAHLLLQNKISLEEEMQLQQWYDHDHNLEEPLVIPKEFAASRAAHASRILNAINAAILTRRTVRLWPRVAVAAAIAAVFVAGALWVIQKPETVPVQQTASVTDIPPGKQGATLTLSSGRKIKLTGARSGELAKEAGVSISKSADGKLEYQIIGNSESENVINTLSTANGESYQVRLPDGSLAVLNAASSLSYPANFKGSAQRRVKLVGEGYFSVAKDKRHPFIVEAGGQEVQAVGTHFNINAYGDEPVTRTTLLEGSVRVSAQGGQNLSKVILRPNEQAILSGGSLKVSAADTEVAVDWKNGDFIFRDEPLESVMRKVARWYDVQIEYAPDAPRNVMLGGFVSRSRNISAVLEMLLLTKEVNFKVRGRTVTVTR